MKLLQLQTKVFADKTETLNYIEKFIKNTITPEVDFIALPEMFSCPYEINFFHCMLKHIATLLINFAKI